jgi:hypothetical protein
MTTPKRTTRLADAATNALTRTKEEAMSADRRTDIVDRGESNNPSRPRQGGRRRLTVGSLVLLGFLLGTALGCAPTRHVRHAEPGAGPARQEVATFLQYAARNEVDNAYALLSEEARRTTTREQMAQLLASRELFTGYSQLRQITFQTQAVVGQPARYHYSGTIIYTDGEQGQVTAVLVKDRGALKLSRIQVTVSPQRVARFQPGTTPAASAPTT